PGRVADALRSGANAVLIKPVPIETIVQTARDMVEGSSPGPASTVMPPTTAVGSAVAVGAQQPGKARAAARRRDAIGRFATTAPLYRPPALTCPECDGALVYQVTHYGGINPTAVERWDEFACESGCGARFEYRVRTRRLRRMVPGDCRDFAGRSRTFRALEHQAPISPGVRSENRREREASKRR